MTINIETLKAHVEAFIQKEGQEIGGMLHNTVARFTEYVEGKQAEADAIALLQSKGYTVTVPPVILPKV